MRSLHAFISFAMAGWTTFQSGFQFQPRGLSEGFVCGCERRCRIGEFRSGEGPLRGKKSMFIYREHWKKWLFSTAPWARSEVHGYRWVMRIKPTPWTKFTVDSFESSWGRWLFEWSCVWKGKTAGKGNLEGLYTRSEEHKKRTSWQVTSSSRSTWMFLELASLFLCLLADVEVKQLSSTTLGISIHWWR